MTFTLVYYETNKLTVKVEAPTVEQAIHQSDLDPSWEGAQEESLGTNGVEEAYDESGKLIYLADDHDED